MAPNSPVPPGGDAPSARWWPVEDLNPDDATNPDAPSLGAEWSRTPDLGSFRRKVLGTEGFVVPAHRSVEAAAGPSGGRPPRLYRRGEAIAFHPPLLRPE